MKLPAAMTALVLLAGAAPAQDPKKTDPPATKPTPPPPARPGLAPEQIVNSLLERMDANKDGKISKEEARNRIADSFSTIDTNKDGYLDRAELLAMARRLAAQPGRPGPPGGPRPGGFPGRADPLDFDSLDKNADGRLTREELKGTRFADVFAQIDRNNDGRIDPKEWEAYHKIKK